MNNLVQVRLHYNVLIYMDEIYYFTNLKWILVIVPFFIRFFSIYVHCIVFVANCSYKTRKILFKKGIK